MWFIEYFLGFPALVHADWASQHSLIRELISPLFAALFGAWAGARMAYRAEARKVNLRQFNSIVSVYSMAAMICTTALSFKQHYLSAMIKRFEIERAEFIKSGHSISNPKFWGLNLRIIPKPRFLNERFTDQIFGIEGMDSQTIAHVDPLNSACSSLVDLVEDRNLLIGERRGHEGDGQQEQDLYWYFGIRDSSGQTDSRYAENLQNLLASTDQIIFHSRAIYEQMAFRAYKQRKLLPRSVRAASGIMPANFSNQEDAGLFPDKERFSSWLGSNKKQKIGRWWWTGRRREKEFLKEAGLGSYLRD